MAAHLATAHVQNAKAYVAVAINGAPQADVRAIAKDAFADLGVEMDGLDNSHHSQCYGNYFCYSQAVAA